MAKKDKTTTSNTDNTTQSQLTQQALYDAQQQNQILQASLKEAQSRQQGVPNLVTTGTYATPSVIDHGLAGKTIFSTSPNQTVLPDYSTFRNITNNKINTFNEVQHLKDNWQNTISAIDPLSADYGQFEELYKNTEQAINELAGKEDLENYGRYVKDITNKMLNDWGGNVLMSRKSQQSKDLAAIEEKANSFELGKEGGYNPKQAAYARKLTNARLTPMERNPVTGQWNTSLASIPNLIEHIDIPKRVDELIKGWKESKKVITDSEGNIIYTGDVPGKLGYETITFTNEGELRSWAMKSLQASGLQEYINQEAAIETSNFVDTLITNYKPEDYPILMNELVSSLESSYNGTENTGALITKLKKDYGDDLSEVLLTNNGQLLQQLFAAQYVDNSIGLGAAKYTSNERELTFVDNLEEELALKTADATYRASLGLVDGAQPGSTNSGTGSNSDIPEPQGKESYAIITNVLGVMNHSGNTISSAFTFAEESRDNYKQALATYNKDSNNPNISAGILERSRQALEAADAELKAFEEVKSNIFKNVNTYLGKNINFGKTFSNIWEKLKKEDANASWINRKAFNNMVSELVGHASKEDASQSDLYAIYAKYGLPDANKYALAAQSEVAGVKSSSRGAVIQQEGSAVNIEKFRHINDLYKTIQRNIKSLPDVDKNAILSPNTDVTVIDSIGEGATHVALSKFRHTQELIQENTRKDRGNSLRMFDNDRNLVPLNVGIGNIVGDDDISNMIDWDKTVVKPMISKDYALSRAGGNGAQYAVQLYIDKNSDYYKKNKASYDKKLKNGYLSVVATSSAANVESEKAVISTAAKQLFFDIAQRNSNTNADNFKTLLSLGTQFGNYSGIADDFNKASWYDLNHGQVRKVEVNGIPVALKAFDDSGTPAMLNKDFGIYSYTDGDDDNNPSQMLVQNTKSGMTEFISVSDYNASLKNKKEDTYKQIYANTPSDAMAYIVTTQLYNASVNNTPTYAGGGDLSTASNYKMPQDIQRIALVTRLTESSNNYNSKGDIGIGAYQVIPSQHSKKIKETLGLTMKQFRASKEAQDAYFHLMFKESQAYFGNVKGNKVLTMIRKEIPDAGIEELYNAYHFWGSSNLNKLLNGTYNIHTGLTYNYTNKAGKKVTGTNPSLITHLKKVNKNKKLIVK